MCVVAWLAFFVSKMKKKNNMFHHRIAIAQRLYMSGSNEHLTHHFPYAYSHFWLTEKLNIQRKKTCHPFWIDKIWYWHHCDTKHWINDNWMVERILIEVTLLLYPGDNPKYSCTSVCICWQSHIYTQKKSCYIYPFLLLLLFCLTC